MPENKSYSAPCIRYSIASFCGPSVRPHKCFALQNSQLQHQLHQSRADKHRLQGMKALPARAEGDNDGVSPTLSYRTHDNAPPNFMSDGSVRSSPVPPPPVQHTPNGNGNASPKKSMASKKALTGYAAKSRTRAGGCGVRVGMAK